MKHLEAAALEVAWGIAKHGALKTDTEEKLIAKVAEIYPKVLAALPKPKLNYTSRNPRAIFKR
jgi:hypothetical protein